MLSSSSIANAAYPDVKSSQLTKISLRKMTLVAAAGNYVSPNKWRFTLNSPMKNVVLLDWALIANVGGPCLLSIDEIPGSGITSSGQAYFCSLIGGSTQNLLAKPMPSSLFQPIAFNQLTLTLDATFVQANGWFIELYVYVQE
jgi:hypothetical protein